MNIPPLPVFPAVNTKRKPNTLYRLLNDVVWVDRHQFGTYLTTLLHTSDARDLWDFLANEEYQ